MTKFFSTLAATRIISVGERLLRVGGDVEPRRAPRVPHCERPHPLGRRDRPALPRQLVPGHGGPGPLRGQRDQHREHHVCTVLQCFALIHSSSLASLIRR